MSPSATVLLLVLASVRLYVNYIDLQKLLHIIYYSISVIDVLFNSSLKWTYFVFIVFYWYNNFGFTSLTLQFLKWIFLKYQ